MIFVFIIFVVSRCVAFAIRFALYGSCVRCALHYNSIFAGNENGANAEHISKCLRRENIVLLCAAVSSRKVWRMEMSRSDASFVIAEVVAFAHGNSACTSTAAEIQLIRNVTDWRWVRRRMQQQSRTNSSRLKYKPFSLDRCHSETAATNKNTCFAAACRLRITSRIQLNLMLWAKISVESSAFFIEKMKMYVIADAPLHSLSGWRRRRRCEITTNFYFVVL